MTASSNPHGSTCRVSRRWRARSGVHAVSAHDVDLLPGRPMINAVTSSAISDGRVNFETLVSSVSARLLAIPLERVDSAVEEVLDDIRAFFGADRCAWLILSADQR